MGLEVLTVSMGQRQLSLSPWEPSVRRWINFIYHRNHHVQGDDRKVVSPSVSSIVSKFVPKHRANNIHVTARQHYL